MIEIIIISVIGYGASLIIIALSLSFFGDAVRFYPSDKQKAYRHINIMIVGLGLAMMIAAVTRLLTWGAL